VAPGEDLVGVATVGGVHAVEAEVVDDEEVHGEELSELGVVTVVEASVAQRL
jgi:hypothetical protein